MRLARYAVPMLLATLTTSASAADWFVAPDGKNSNAGTKDAPWDIAITLSGGQKKVQPGDTIWLKGGTYKVPWTKGKQSYGYEVRLAGAPDKHIKIRPVTGERAIIDGGLNLPETTTYVWIQDLEIMASEPRPDKVLGPANTANALPPESDISLYRPWSGLNVYGGKDMKFINLIIHDNCQGSSWWVASEGEMYGCIIYNNGWQASDRGHGHCVYTQNKDGTKVISNCIMSSMFDGTYCVHAYGSANAYVDNYVVEDNFIYEKGPLLIGGGRPSKNVKALRNVCFNVPLKFGYSSQENEDGELKDNLIVGEALALKKFKTLVNENNTVVKAGQGAPKTVFLINKYDENRAHLAVYNPQKAATFAVKMDKFIKGGETVKLLDPKDFYGKPLWEGKATGDTLNVPTPKDCNVYVVLKVPSTK